MALCNSSKENPSYRLPSRRVETKRLWQQVNSDRCTIPATCLCTTLDTTANPVHLPSGHAHPQLESRRSLPTHGQARGGYFEEISPYHPAQFLLRTRDLWQATYSEEGDGAPVTFRNHATNSMIEEISFTGLCRNNRYLGIVEFKISSSLPQPQYAIVRLCGFGNNCEVAGSVISFQDGVVRITLAGVLSLQKIFYCRDTHIKLEVELFSHSPDLTSATENECSCPHVYQPTDYTGHSNILVPCSRFPILSPHPEYVLNGHPFHFEAENLSVIDACKRANSNFAFTEKMADVLDDCFSINLDCREFYAAVKNTNVKVCPCYFKVPMETQKVVRILPYRGDDEHLSLWAETDFPIQPSQKITIEAKAFDPARSYKQLGESVKLTQSVARLQQDKVYTSLKNVMLQMFMFYCEQVQIRINVAIH